METKQVWVKRPEEWIKQNPGKPTMYKTTIIQGETPEELTQGLTNHAKRAYTKRDKQNDIGIYAIICEPAKRAYIGQSINVQTRLRSHKLAIKSNSAPCYQQMRQDIQEHGANSFEFIRIKHIPTGDNLTEEENNSMADYIEKGYKLYNQQININNIYVNPKHKALIEGIIKAINLNPDIIQNIKALIN